MWWKIGELMNADANVLLFRNVFRNPRPILLMFDEKGGNVDKLNDNEKKKFRRFKFKNKIEENKMKDL